MTFLLWLCLLMVLLHMGQLVCAWLLLGRYQDRPRELTGPEPSVAVLLPVRNEAHNLPGCLQSLLQLDYPSEKLHILVGNDASTDLTESIARDWSRRYTTIKVFNIHNRLGAAKGKANVLAQLAHQCPPEVQYLFFTDADIRPNPRWIRSMLAEMAPGVGLVNGTTLVGGRRRFDYWQQTDWALAIGLAKAYTYLPYIGRTLTAMGNNMLVSRQAYQATGGYESFPFSITEDLELMVQVKQRGFSTHHLLERGSSTLSEPISNFKELLHQRRRWMTGAMRLPLPMVLMLANQGLFLPALVLLGQFQPFVALFLGILKLFIQHLLARRVLIKVGIYRMPKAGFFYECYQFALTAILIITYYLPLKITWKDRDYRNNRA